jgi:hypothetical protein
MNATVVTQVSSFDVKKLSVSPLKALDNGAKMAYVNYDGGSLILQAPAMMTPYGMDVYDKGPKVKYSVQFSLRDYETNPKMQAFYQVLQQIDDFMIDQGVKNSKAWFKKEQSREMVSEFYTSLMRFSKDADGNLKPYPPTLKLNLVNRGGTFEAKMYDDKKRLYEGVPMEELVVRNMQAIPTVRFAFVWLADKKFGVTTNAHQMLITKLPESLAGCGIVADAADGDDADADAEGAVEAVPTRAPAAIAVPRAAIAVPPAAAAAAIPAAVSVLEAAVVDDDEVIGEAAPVDEEPVPVPKKTIAIKKKVVSVVKK